MIKKGLLVLSIMTLVACGGETTTDTQQVASVESEVSETDLNAQSTDENPSVEQEVEEQPKVSWYFDDLSEPIKNVGVLNAQDIIESSGLTPVKTLESSDPEGEPKNIYLFSESSLSAQFEHSPNVITLQWYQASDDPESIEHSQQSLKDIYKIARAIAGMEGYDAISYISNGGKYRSKPVGGYPATGQCNDYICFINIDLRQ